MVNRKGQHTLKAFVCDPSDGKASHCIDVPAILAVLIDDRREHGKYSEDVIGLVSWLNNRSQEVLEGLMKYRDIPKCREGGKVPTAWQIVSTLNW
jgi:hypothetical protein